MEKAGNNPYSTVIIIYYPKFSIFIYYPKLKILKNKNLIFKAIQVTSSDF